ncbi:unnamed protein product [Sphagnum troendelagicum]
MATNFLLLVKAAIDEAEGLTSGENEQRLKLNKLQCKCIVEKLSAQTQEILNSVESTCTDSAVGFEPYEATLKELYRVVTDALSLIKDCCAEKWLLRAIKQRAGTNIEDFAKILYEIEWCTLILCSIIPRNETTWLGEKYAKKVFHKNGNECQSLKIESDILTRICHPNVVRTVCWSEDTDKCSLVMDLMDSDLSKFLKDVPRLSILAAVGLMLEVAEGMKYLHGRAPRGDEVQLQNVNIHPSGTKLIQVQGPWGAPTRTGWSFCEGVTAAITGFKISFSLTHKAIWGLRVYYDLMDGQAFHSDHGSWATDPLAGETEIRFRHPYEYLEQIEGSYGVTPALSWNGKFHDVVNGTAATTVGRNNPFTVISSLTFKSNKETYGPYGVTGDTPFKTDVGKIVGIFGRAGTCLDRIGVFIRRPEVII